MKNSFLVLAAVLLMSGSFANAKTLVCGKRGVVKSVDLDLFRCMRQPNLKPNGDVDTLACYHGSNQVIVSRQDNGKSALIEIEFVNTGRIDAQNDMMTQTLTNVNCTIRNN